MQGPQTIVREGVPEGLDLDPEPRPEQYRRHEEHGDPEGGGGGVPGEFHARPTRQPPHGREERSLPIGTPRRHRQAVRQADRRDPLGSPPLGIARQLRHRLTRQWEVVPLRTEEDEMFERREIDGGLRHPPTDRGPPCQAPVGGHVGGAQSFGDAVMRDRPRPGARDDEPARLQPLEGAAHQIVGRGQRELARDPPEGRIG